MMLDIKDVARDRHKHVMGLNRLKEYINKQMIKKKNAQIHFHSKRPYTGTITKMNDIIDIDSTITGSLYYFNYIVVVSFIGVSG